MLALENADEILQILDRFTKQKSKEIPPELEEYIDYVAKTGDTVYRWPTVQYLFREKLLSVIKEFHDTTASIEDLPPCPNVDQFNYESMKTLLFERFDHFKAAPFTIQRLCELLTAPKKHYTRLDKFMRALEKNILVVSTIEPGKKPSDAEENGEESMNGDILSAIGVGVELAKNLPKSASENTNGNSDNGASAEVPQDEIASSSGVTKIDSGEKINENTPKPESNDNNVAKGSTDDEKPVKEDATLESDDKKEEPKSAEPSNEVTTTDKTDIDATVNEEPITQKTEENAKMESIESSEAKAKNDDTCETQSSESVQNDPKSPVKETIINEKPPTPKRACSSIDDDDDDDAGHSNDDRNAKKMKLDTSSENNDAIAAIEPQSDVSNVEPTSDNNSVTTKNDETPKESDLLDNVVDAVLAAEEKTVESSEIPAITVNPVEIDVIEKSDAAIESIGGVEEKSAPIIAQTDDVIAPVSSELIDDILTPDEALNELVSSDLATNAELIQAEPIIEDKIPETDENNIAEPIVAQDDMTVEDNEAAAAVATESTPDVVDAENAMEAAPIKTDEEQMDVDESNSPDAMDL